MQWCSVAHSIWVKEKEWSSIACLNAADLVHRWAYQAFKESCGLTSLRIKLSKHAVVLVSRAAFWSLKYTTHSDEFHRARDARDPQRYVPCSPPGRYEMVQSTCFPEITERKIVKEWVTIQTFFHESDITFWFKKFVIYFKSKGEKIKLHEQYY